MIDRERFKLLHGPYKAPRCKLGRVLFCGMRGEVVVKGISAGRIPWHMTRGRRGRAAFILCGDLVRSV
jgi:hypothetical protein